MAAQTQTPAKNKEKKNFHQSIARSDTGCFLIIKCIYAKGQTVYSIEGRCPLRY